MDISEYYHQTFRGDLSSFMGNTSVPYFGHNWFMECQGLERVPDTKRPCFLFCIYFTVLVDQSMYSHYYQYYQRFEQLTHYPKFCRGLAQFHYNPIGILSAPIDQNLVNKEDLQSILDSGMKLFVDEVISFFRDHMTEIDPKDFFNSLVYDPDVQVPLLSVMVDKNVLDDEKEFVVHFLTLDLMLEFRIYPIT